MTGPDFTAHRAGNGRDGGASGAGPGLSALPGVSGAALLNDRLGSLGDYPFTRLAALLDPVAPPPGIAPLALSVGEPQHAPPPLIAETLTAHAALWGKYPPVAGTPAFRAAVAGWLMRRYALPAGFVDADHGILPVSGTREALFQLALLTVSPGRGGQRPAVLMPDPFYAVYEGAAVLAGAEPLFLPATAATGHLPDLDAVPAETLARTALVYLCSPANPQGAVADLDRLARALTLARRHGFVLAVDECYAEIWDSAPPPGALQAALAMGGPEPLANLLVFHSLSKRSNAAGLRSGFVAGDPELIRPFARLRSYSLAGMPLPVAAASAALWADDAHVEENRRLYRAKIDAAERHLAGRLGFTRPPGGFFLWLDVGTAGLDGETAARELWRQAAIRVLPGAYLSRTPDGGRTHIRVALVHDTETVARAAETIARILT